MVLSSDKKFWSYTWITLIIWLFKVCILLWATLTSLLSAIRRNTKHPQVNAFSLVLFLIHFISTTKVSIFMNLLTYHLLARLSASLVEARLRWDAASPLGPAPSGWGRMWGESLVRPNSRGDFRWCAMRRNQAGKFTTSSNTRGPEETGLFPVLSTTRVSSRVCDTSRNAEREPRHVAVGGNVPVGALVKHLLGKLGVDGVSLHLHILHVPQAAHAQGRGICVPTMLQHRQDREEVAGGEVAPSPTCQVGMGAQPPFALSV